MPGPLRVDRTCRRSTTVIAGLAVLAMLGGPVAGRSLRILSSRWSTSTARPIPTIDVVVSVPMVLSGQRLGVEDFRIMEGSEPRPVEVSPLDPAGLELAIVIDSTMAGEAFLSARGALMEVPVHLSEPTISVVSAAESPVIVQRPTRDRNATSAALHGLVPRSGVTDIESGIALALSNSARENHGVRSSF